MIFATKIFAFLLGVWGVFWNARKMVKYSQWKLRPSPVPGSFFTSAETSAKRKLRKAVSH